MSTNLRRQDELSAPPPLDESYWSSLLGEGEYSASVMPDVGDNGHFSAHAETADHEAAEAESRHDGTDLDWVEIERLMIRDEVIEAIVMGYNRGGLLVEWRTLRGFVPASQLVDFPATSNNILRRNAMASRMTQPLQLRVIELRPAQNRLILSERAARVRAGERADILERLRTGDVISGSITNLCDFGAFVDLGGLEGLIHISELSWGRVGHPMDILERSQQVRVYVLEVNKDAGRIALSLKRLRPDPWETVSERYCIDQTVEGLITNVVDFGAVASIS
ncbi:MAG: S1 RNA-binding domain-containing protein [Burkholderiales bacterium]|nr:S1 RNA-binding domain-containing protein [Anaerolineae bacterium]